MPNDSQMTIDLRKGAVVAPKKQSTTSWEVVGEIGVDAGLCWVGDPGYILHRGTGENPEDIGLNWDAFCEKIGEKDVTQFHYDLGHAGLIP